jgi:RNA-directed DNA polymerase
MKVHQSIFDRIITPENLFAAWEEFRKGKQSRNDVQLFEQNVERSLFQLHRELQSGTYRHGPYSAFTICDPKQRPIHKATVRDRVIHHAVFSVLNPVFEPAFISHSFSCRVGKGTHKAVSALESMLLKVSRNNTHPCFVLKCDIHQFFASVDHQILLQIMVQRISDARAMQLLREIIGSFPEDKSGKGIPIGNLTSQLFANVYMNEFDQCMKHVLRVKNYIRYTDDFVIVAENEDYFQELLPLIGGFLESRLFLHLHPHKVGVRKYRQGIDFLGYVLLPYHRAVRTKTKKRVFRKLHARTKQFHDTIIGIETAEQSLQSYLGVLSHADTHRLGQQLQNQYWFWMTDTQ